MKKTEEDKYNSLRLIFTLGMLAEEEPKRGPVCVMTIEVVYNMFLATKQVKENSDKPRKEKAWRGL